jgi:hypothetical protein
MSEKKSLLMLLLLISLVLALAAGVHAGLTSAPAVDSLFAQINAGNLEQAQALFAEDAVYTNNLTGRSCDGFAEIEEDLASWQHPGRRYDIVAVTEAGDSLQIMVEVSDRGIVWARERMTADLSDGLIQSLELDDVRLLSFPYKASNASS